VYGANAPNTALNALPVEPSSTNVDALNRIVAGLTAFVLDFDGPRTAYIGTSPLTEYVTLCSHGVKTQGEAAPCFGQQEAVELYAEQLRLMIAENRDKQLAWRCRPRLECDGGPVKCRVYSRLAFI
jgi:hypothetical protein